MTQITTDEIIKTIDTSKMEKFLDLDGICDELDIYEYVYQPEENQKLTYCFYQKWICSDTEVGIKVWYLDNKPVCISWKEDWKCRESFGWISSDSFFNTRTYLRSLIMRSLIKDIDFSHIEIITDEKINEVVTEFDCITGKTNEELNKIW